MNVVFEGKGSTDQYARGKSCPRCKRRRVRYLGTTVISGNPLSPASDVDVDHHYRCGDPDCGQEWEGSE